MAKKVKFSTGFLAGNELKHTIRMAQLAEKLGFETCWVGEDYFYGGAFSAATACAMQTSSIKIGIGVINPYTRHPALSSMEFGALDSISEGRTIIGIGASNKRWIEEQMGIPFKKPLTAMKEMTEIMSGLFGNSAIEYEGELFNTGKISLGFKPYRRHVPIYIGAKGPKVLQMVGESADGVLTSIMTSVPYLSFVKDNIAIGAKKAGRDPNEIKIAAYLIISISENREEAREAVKPMLAQYLGIHGDHPILTTAGMEVDHALAFRECMIKGESADHLIDDWVIDTFTIAGTPEECREKYKRIIQAGVDSPVAFEIPGIPMEETLRQVHDHLFDIEIN